MLSVAPVVSDEVRALHESAHAVVWLAWPGPDRSLIEVSIVSHRTHAGEILSGEEVATLRDGRADEATVATYRAALACLWAGPVGDRRRGRDDWATVGAVDLRHIAELQAVAGIDARQLIGEVAALLDAHDEALTRLASVLRVRQEMNGDEVRAVVDG